MQCFWKPRLRENQQRLAFVRQMRRATMGMSVMPTFSASLRGSCRVMQGLRLQFLYPQIVQETWSA